ncbi:hypothetical protein AB1046_07315 [Promicromonospora sp. Populi]|uniref:hypothetical protein n=1 Tax=Promicromonospora sp. Populi TaxID=3239420 RepID=UPI0034E21372
MTSPHVPAQPYSVPWALVAGLSAMALLWPLTGLTGIFGTGAPRAFLIIGITAAVWIGVVGLGSVPRPVLTLTLTGVAYGLVAAAMGQLLPALGGFTGPGAPAWTVLPALLFDALWGAVAGLAAAGVQRLRGAGR